MTEKYIDLEGEINLHIPGIGAHPDPDEDTRLDRRAVLAWLDAHLDQVPGRTITESELYDVQIHTGFSGTDPRFRNVMRDLGITVVSDPEPTDVEKLAEVIHDAVLDIDQHIEGPDIEALAEWLFEHGVKAPGGDDE